MIRISSFNAEDVVHADNKRTIAPHHKIEEELA